VDRRTLLTRSRRLAALGIWLSALPPWLRDAAAAEASPFLERNAWPEHWETKLPFLGNTDRTANDAFFVRSHFPVPEPATAMWKLEITGLVRNPLTPKSAEGTALGLVLLCVLPLVTRLCVAVLVGLGPALLGEAAALQRRIGWPGPAALPAGPGPAGLYGRIGLPGLDPGLAPGPASAVTAESAALRRLERDIHDGPQQRLVRLAMDLGRAQHHLASRPEAAEAVLADAIAQTRETLDELRALSRGIAPPVLADRGLRAALAALAARSTIRAELDAGPLDQRLDPAAETAAYFVIAEALANAAKHSHAHRCVIGLRHGHRTLRVWLTDDGVGGAALVKGHGLRGLDHRLHAVGGRLTVTSPSGGPTTVAAELPCC